MGMFDNLFGKKGSQKSGDINVTNLTKGDMFDYDLSSWKVQEVYLYDWGNKHFSREYKISNGQQTAFMDVEPEDGELTISITHSINIRSIDENLPDILLKEGKAPNTLMYDGIQFYLDDKYPGHYKKETAGHKEWEAFIAWDYYDKDEKYILSLEQWEKDEFEAFYGVLAKADKFSNFILQG